MFRPHTPNGELARILKEIVQEQKAEGVIIKVEERAGIKYLDTRYVADFEIHREIKMLWSF